MCFWSGFVRALPVSLMGLLTYIADALFRGHCLPLARFFFDTGIQKVVECHVRLSLVMVGEVSVILAVLMIINVPEYHRTREESGGAAGLRVVAPALQEVSIVLHGPLLGVPPTQDVRRRVNVHARRGKRDSPARDVRRFVVVV